MATEETRAETAAHGRITSGRQRVADFVRNSPFLILSLLFHVFVLLLLTFITAQEPEPPKRDIKVEMEEVETDEMEPEPPERETDLDTEATSSALSGSGSEGQGESHSDAAESAADVDAENVDIMGMESAVADGGEGDFEGEGGGGWDVAAGDGRGGGVGGAVDKFAVATINAIANGRTIVVLMIDRSRSVVYGDLPELVDRMNHYFDEIDKHLPVELTGQGKWQVMSYGEEPKLKGQPSDDLDYVKEALGSVSVETSGKENVGAGIEMILDKYEDSEYENILVACLTDEAGDDIQDPVVLKRAVNRMRKTNTRFFVFGYEAVFATRKKRVHLKLDEDNLETMQGEDRDAMRGYEGKTVFGWADAGPASPRPELWWGDDWRRWKRWGATVEGIYSGFGMYALNHMTLATNGTYFILEDESEEYDLDKMMAKYRPDICDKFEYDKRNERSELRKALSETWKEIGRFYLETNLHTEKAVKKNIRRAEEGRDYCIQRAKQIDKLIDESEPEGQNSERWIAHAELTRAELLRLRFMLGEYYLTLSEAAKEHSGAIKNLKQKDKRIIMRRGKAPDDYKGPQQAKKERSLAKEFIETTIDKHNDTPWGVLSKRMNKNIFPWKAKLEDKPTWDSRPSLAF
ncbi:MAG: vWA domain-containing protein [Planctomycetota bacterium]